MKLIKEKEGGSILEVEGRRDRLITRDEHAEGEAELYMSRYHCSMRIMNRELQGKLLVPLHTHLYEL